MFVCLGNICRSPMAEFVFRDMLEKAGRADEFTVSSAATSDETVWNGIGEPVYPPVKKLLDKKGISCAGKRSQVLTKAHGEEFDLLVCMDDSNVRNARRIVGEENAHKCVKLLSFAGENGNVADPWYTRDFEMAYADIKRGLQGLLGE